ncbi:MAG: hypothetical protein C4567_00035 [Deltaproteobacteria bacterium]|nr:MAG: hypothetical protein C4567_00035 [Deltaproteobacteria bacterium]
MALLSGMIRLPLLAPSRGKNWMTKLIIVATMGFFLLGLEGARAQQKVEPPSIPPLLETPRPLENLETKEPAAPQNTPVSRKSPGKGPAAHRNTPVAMMSIGKERANVRAKPNLKSDILFQVFQGDPIKVEKQKDDWVYITDYKHNAGWVYKPLVSNTRTVVVLVDNANIRKGPGSKGPVARKGSEGEIYKLFAEKGRWVKVGYYWENKVIGWIRDDLVWGE